MLFLILWSYFLNFYFYIKHLELYLNCSIFKKEHYSSFGFKVLSATCFGITSLKVMSGYSQDIL